MTTIIIDKYPQLSSLCWSRDSRDIDEQDAFQLYESGWRFIEKDRLTTEEREFITRLTERYGNGVLNV